MYEFQIGRINGRRSMSANDVGRKWLRKEKAKERRSITSHLRVLVARSTNKFAVPRKLVCRCSCPCVTLAGPIIAISQAIPSKPPLCGVSGILVDIDVKSQPTPPDKWSFPAEAVVSGGGWLRMGFRKSL